MNHLYILKKFSSQVLPNSVMGTTYLLKPETEASLLSLMYLQTNPSVCI